MNHAGLHHIEMCVSNGRKTVSYFTDQLGFSLRATRETSSSKQWVVGSRKAIFVVTQRIRNHQKTALTEPDHFTQFCCSDDLNHSVDSVFNVALEVKNVRDLAAKMCRSGARLLRPVTEITNEHGTVRYADLGSCCGNIIHTLLDKSQYTGPFLPTFDPVDNKSVNEEAKELITHMDHITYVCNPGESSSIISWYEDCLGMKKFKVNADEDVNEGLVFRGNVGMRLRVINYWPCAETGVCHPDGEEDSLKIVIAESLPMQSTLSSYSFISIDLIRLNVQRTHTSALF